MTSQLIKKVLEMDKKCFLNFVEKLHKIIPSASLIPDDTVVLTIKIPNQFLGLKKDHQKDYI